MKMNDSEVRAILKAFIYGGTGEWDWDDFISSPIKDAYLNAIRIICRDLPVRFPPEIGSSAYCSEEGWNTLKVIEANLLPPSASTSTR
jgi:hypothetical protein